MKCPRCESTEISKNGTRNHKQNFICKQCGRQFIEYSSMRGYSTEVRQICLRMRRKGMAYRKIEELTGVSHNTVIAWDKDVINEEKLSQKDPTSIAHGQPSIESKTIFLNDDSFHE